MCPAQGAHRAPPAAPGTAFRNSDGLLAGHSGLAAVRVGRRPVGASAASAGPAPSNARCKVTGAGAPSCARGMAGDSDAVTPAPSRPWGTEVAEVASGGGEGRGEALPAQQPLSAARCRVQSPGCERAAPWKGPERPRGGPGVRTPHRSILTPPPPFPGPRLICVSVVFTASWAGPACPPRHSDTFPVSRLPAGEQLPHNSLRHPRPGQVGSGRPGLCRGYKYLRTSSVSSSLTSFPEDMGRRGAGSEGSGRLSGTCQAALQEDGPGRRCVSVHLPVPCSRCGRKQAACGPAAGPAG